MKCLKLTDGYIIAFYTNVKINVSARVPRTITCTIKAITCALPAAALKPDCAEVKHDTGEMPVGRLCI